LSVANRSAKSARIFESAALTAHLPRSQHFITKYQHQSPVISIAQFIRLCVPVSLVKVMPLFQLFQLELGTLETGGLGVLQHEQNMYNDDVDLGFDLV